MNFLKRYYIIYLMLFSLLVGGAAWFTQRSAAVSASAEPDFSRIVIIDPGHGGEDGGAVSCAGRKESDLNLQISLRLRDLLGLMGVPVRMIRTEDISVYSPEAESIAEKKVSDLKNRVKTVNETPNALLISIHQNFFSEEKYSGAQIFYAETQGSRELADGLQQAIQSQVDPGNRRQAKPASDVYLMEKITCPGILVECGFLSNKREETLLHTEEYQKKIVGAIAACTVNYLTEEPKKDEV